MDKKGEISEAGIVIKDLLIAALCILALVSIIIAVVSIFGGEDKTAKEFIENIGAKIENLEDGQENSFAIQTVSGWVLVGYNFSDISRPPNKCFMNSCLCICRDSPLNCNDAGICRPIDRNITVYSNGNSYYQMPQTNALVPFRILKTTPSIAISVAGN